MQEEWGTYLEEAAQIIESREKYQRTLGRLATDLVAKYGRSSLKEFSSLIKETYGLSVSANTLANYRWVWQKTHKLGLPEDLSYRTLQYIASSEAPEYWANKIKNEGLSSVDLYYMLRKERGLKENRVKRVICPKCEHEFEMSAH